MTEDRQTDSTAGAADAATGDAVAPSGGQTVEEVEAIYRGRLSGKDRAHNAETAALRAQIEALKAQPAPAPVGESPEAAQVRELQAQLARSEAARQAEGLRAKYPFAASVLGDTITTLPEEKIAAINALPAEGPANGGGSVIDPNNAGRRATAQQPPSAKPINEKTKDELLADLSRMAPAIQAAAREGEF